MSERTGRNLPSRIFSRALLPHLLSRALHSTFAVGKYLTASANPCAAADLAHIVHHLEFTLRELFFLEHMLKPIVLWKIRLPSAADHAGIFPHYLFGICSKKVFLVKHIITPFGSEGKKLRNVILKDK